MEITIKEVLRNLIDKMITEDIKLDTIDITVGGTAVMINGSVYVDISNVDEGEFSTGVVNGEHYTLSTSENLDKVIELLKEN
ncbi:hypothetical protein [Staphylococcus equorum]|uniref:hypothetical protein n=1 Tax=Staphylococcus equorum TaxID=246432 RepID=UPI003FD82883